MELEDAVKKLFEDCRAYCKVVTNENTLEKNKIYKQKLEDLLKVWKLHNERTQELLAKSINKCESNIVLLSKK